MPHIEPQIERKRKCNTSDIINPVSETIEPIFIITVPKSKDENVAMIRPNRVAVVAFTKCLDMVGMIIIILLNFFFCMMI